MCGSDGGVDKDWGAVPCPSPYRTRQGDAPGGAVRINATCVSAPADAGVSIMIEPGIQRSCGNCHPVGSR